MKKQLQQDIFENFGEDMETETRKEFVVLNRYIRPFEFNGCKSTVSPKGGIVFHFYINQVQQTLTYTWAQCHPEDNFCRKTGTKIAAQRFEGLYKSDKPNDLIQTIEYDRGLSLIENVHMDLLQRYNEKLSKSWSKELYTMFKQLDTIIFDQKFNKSVGKYL